MPDTAAGFRRRSPTESRQDADVVKVWTLTTWMHGARPESFDYRFPSQESAERNGRMFQQDDRATRWRVTGPDGVEVHLWERATGTPSEMGWVR